MSKRSFDFEEVVEFYTTVEESTTNAQPVKKKYKYVCVHGVEKRRCREGCGGNAYCIHDKRKDYCKECNGSAYCIHGKNKRYCKEGCGGSAYCEHGKQKTKCKECGGSGLCTHGKEKYQCKDCGGSGICVHGKQKYHCKECGGSAFCIHDKEKRYCKEGCGGNALCIHGKHKSHCKDCKGNSYCIHGKQKPRCKEGCGGNAYCIHGIYKQRCKECDGSALCEHNKRKENCKECDGSAYCVHGKLKKYCKEGCGGSAYCIHGKNKQRCKEGCGGSAYCSHNKRKEYCKQCGGTGLCSNSWCETQKNPKCNGHCTRCYINMFPDEPFARNYKTKENSVVDAVMSHFPNFTWKHDVRIEDGCSRRRPDLMLDLGSHVIIVEIDENQHIDYDCSCENKRMMELSQDVAHRPIVFIRFNPDDYVNRNGVNVTSCFKINRSTGILQISAKKSNEWNERVEILKNQIQYWIDNSSEKTLEIVQLFYDGF